MIEKHFGGDLMLGYLNQVEEEAILKLKDSLQDFLGNRLVIFILYGSKARGDFDNDSDIDILLIVDNLDLDTKDNIRDIIVDVRLDYLLPFSVHINSREYYNQQIHNSINLYIKNIQREGIAV